MANKAGNSTRRMAQNRRRTTNFILVGVLILAIILALSIQNWQALGLGGGAVLALLVLLRVLPDLIDKPIKRRIKEERRADRGAAAEEVVGNLLASLGEGFFVVFVYERLDNKSLKEQFQRIYNGDEENIAYLSASIRHIFAHGHLTAHANGINPRKVYNSCASLSNFIVDFMGAEFTKKVKEYQLFLESRDKV
jgi:Na+-transporting methylmalonyl-CoA/oxaloacetate decarboxylase gamma subunit